MAKGKLDFKREELVVGTLYGMFFPERITKIVKEGKASVIVELADCMRPEYKKLGVFKLEETGFYECRIECGEDDFEGAEFWFKAYERDAA
jgi:hypothetical protein